MQIRFFLLLLISWTGGYSQGISIPKINSQSTLAWEFYQPSGLGVQAEFGYLLYDLNTIRAIPDEVRLDRSQFNYAVGLDSRIYQKSLRPEGYYLGIGVYHRQSHHQADQTVCLERNPLTLGNFLSNPCLNLVDNTYGIRKNIWGMRMLLGYQFRCTKRLYLDIFAGASLQNRQQRVKGYLKATDVSPGLFPTIIISALGRDNPPEVREEQSWFEPVPMAGLSLGFRLGPVYL